MVGSPRRRRWGNVLIAAGALVLVSTAVAAYLLPVQYEVFALLNVRRNEPTVLSKAGTSSEEFDVYKRTQVQLMQSTQVLNGVVRNSDINHLSIVKEHLHDPVEWLRGQLRIDYPDDAEVMRVAMKGSNSSEIAKIVDKVVEMYMREIVEASKLRRVAAEAKLRDAFDKETAEYTKKLRELNQLAALHKTKDSEAAQLEKRIAGQQLDALLERQREIARRIDETELKISVQKAESASTAESTPDSQQPAAERPPAEKPAAASPLRALEVERAFWEGKQAALAVDLRDKTKQLAALDNFSADAKAKQEEVESSRLIKTQLGAELERLGVERLAEDRILVIDRAIVENEYGDALPRYSTFASLAALGLSLVGLGLFIRRPAPFAH